MKAVHPGVVLMEEINSRGLMKSMMSGRLGIDHGEFLALCSERASITPHIAQSLADFFGTSSEFWENLQKEYDRDQNIGNL